jgi:hypothetical protein
MKTYTLKLTEAELIHLEMYTYSRMETSIGKNDFNFARRLHSKIEDCIVTNDLDQEDQYEIQNIKEELDHA